jgi:hypothetical protein
MRSLSSFLSLKSGGNVWSEAFHIEDLTNQISFIIGVAMKKTASKTLDLLRAIRHGGPALCSVAVTNACNAACDFCNFARGKVGASNLRWINTDLFDRAS